MPTTRANGVELFYDERGAGPPVLLIMGLATQMVAWEDAFCDQLAERGHRVIRFDNRDVGLSESFAGTEHIDIPTTILRAALRLRVTVPYTLSDMARDATGLMDSLGIDSAHVVGASMGGMIAQTLALESSDRVRSLTSIMSHPGGIRASLAKPRALRALFRPVPKTREEGIEHYVQIYRAFAGTKHRFDADAIRRVAVASIERNVDSHALPRHIGAIMSSGSRRRALRSLRAPTLIVHGTEDPLVRPYGARVMAGLIPDARLEWVDGMGHGLPSWAWDQIVGAITAHVGQVEDAAISAAG